MFFTAQEGENGAIYYFLKLEIKNGEVIKSSKRKFEASYTQPHSYPLSQEIVSSTK